jgi:hypothetical protein
MLAAKSQLTGGTFIKLCQESPIDASSRRMLVERPIMELRMSKSFIVQVRLGGTRLVATTSPSWLPGGQQSMALVFRSSVNAELKWLEDLNAD